MAKETNILSIENSENKEMANLLKYLGNPTRYSILKALYLNPKESMSVTELEAQIDSTQSQTSQYLSVLKTVGLVTSVNKGVRRYYSIADDRINAIFDALKV